MATMTQQESYYYIGRQTQMLHEFDEIADQTRMVLLKRYGAELSDKIMRDAHAEYAALIPRLPYIGGKANPHTWNLVTSAWFLALYRALKPHGEPLDAIGALFIEMIEIWLGRYPRWLLRLIGWWRFTPLYLRRLTRRAHQSQHRRYPDDFVFTVLRGDGQAFDYAVYYSQCAICRLYHHEQADELLPYVCALDEPMCRALGMGLSRSTTLGTGGSKCDFHFKRMYH